MHMTFQRTDDWFYFRRLRKQMSGDDPSGLKNLHSGIKQVRIENKVPVFSGFVAL